jgi:hypothetical protein
MGFAANRVYVLEFREGDPITDGLYVKATAPSLLHSMEAKGKQRKGESDRAYFDRQYTPLVDAIIEWNIEDKHGVTLPITLESWYSIDLPVQVRIFQRWLNLEEVVNADSPLDSSSNEESLSTSTTGPDRSIEASIRSQVLA